MLFNSFTIVKHIKDILPELQTFALLPDAKSSATSSVAKKQNKDFFSDSNSFN